MGWNVSQLRVNAINFRLHFEFSSTCNLWNIFILNIRNVWSCAFLHSISDDDEDVCVPKVSSTTTVIFSKRKVWVFRVYKRKRSFYAFNFPLLHPQQPFSSQQQSFHASSIWRYKFFIVIFAPFIVIFEININLYQMKYLLCYKSIKDIFLFYCIMSLTPRRSPTRFP